MMNCTLSLDHRYGDGSMSMNFVRVMKAYFEDPENFKIESIPDLLSYQELSQKKKAQFAKNK